MNRDGRDRRPRRVHSEDAPRRTHLAIVQLYASHTLDVVMRVSDRIAVMQRGRKAGELVTSEQIG